MPKNIVICCDGTDNKLTINENTNVIHLYSCLEKSHQQSTYYHPGVGTLAPEGIKSKIKRKYYTFKDKIFAKSLENNVKSAYLYLMHHYEEGDKIYLFGFSRGAYTVRMLSGMIELFGLLHKGNQDNLKYAFELYYNERKNKRKDEDEDGDKKKEDINGNLFHLSNSFKSKFSQKVSIHFMGIWDTVVAAGGFLDLYLSFPHSANLKNVKTVRHAVAIDERRKHYDYQKVSATHPNCKEVFFAGVHSDIGGSYPEQGLSKLTLEWMLGEATAAGLKAHQKKADKLLLNAEKEKRPDVFTPIHDSLTWSFKLSDLFPRLRYKKDNLFNTYVDFRLWPLREIPSNAMIHESVFLKMKQSNYKPKKINAEINSYQEIYNQTIIYCDIEYNG